MRDPGSFLEGPFEDPEQRLRRDWKLELSDMREMVLYGMSQKLLTQDNLDMLERRLSKIIKELDHARHAESYRDFSLDDVQHKVRKARKCIAVAYGYIEKASLRSYRQALFDEYEKFTDFLDEAINCLEI
jgi:hypothetical protein